MKNYSVTYRLNDQYYKELIEAPNRDQARNKFEQLNLILLHGKAKLSKLRKA